jgi:hypothetical protein
VQREPPDRPHHGLADVDGERADERRDLGGDQARVAPQRHRRGAGVVGLAGQRELPPRDALHPGDHPDDLAAPLENGPLLDVQLDEGVRRHARHRCSTGPADPLELVAQHGTVDADGRQRRLEVEPSGVNEAAEHVGGEAAALLVGEERHRQRPAGGVAGVLERPHHLEPGEDPERAVVAASGPDGVDVAAGHDGRGARVPPGPGGDDVADPVDPHIEAEVAHPAHDQLAAAGVVVGERQPAVAAVAGVAHRGQGLEVGQQPRTVDRDLVDRDLAHAQIRSHGRTGTRVTSTPVAARIAAAIAAVDEIVGGSPTPLAPSGAPGSGCSMQVASTSGMSAIVGSR